MTDEIEPRGEDAATDGGTDSFDVSADVASETECMGVGPSTEERTEAGSEIEVDFLLEVVRRAPLLRALQSDAAEASELTDSVDMSRSTIHRATNSLEESAIIEQASTEYRLTSLGELIAEEMEQFAARTRTAVALRQFLNSMEMNGNRLPVAHFIDATITRRKSRQPHATIHRIIELFENSDRLRMLSTVISPIYVDVGYREMMNGMQIEAIFDQESVDLMLSEYPERAHEAISTGNFDVYTHDGLPFELFIFDDKVGMAAHNENGNAEVLVECDNPSAIDWAESLYDEHLSKADPIVRGFE